MPGRAALGGGDDNSTANTDPGCSWISKFLDSGVSHFNIAGKRCFNYSRCRRNHWIPWTEREIETGLKQDPNQQYRCRDPRARGCCWETGEQSRHCPEMYRRRTPALPEAFCDTRTRPGVVFRRPGLMGGSQVLTSRKYSICRLKVRPVFPRPEQESPHPSPPR